MRGEEIRGSEVRDLKSEVVKAQRSEVSFLMSDIGDQLSVIGERRAAAFTDYGEPRRAEGKIIRRATGEVRFDE